MADRLRYGNDASNRCSIYYVVVNNSGNSNAQSAEEKKNNFGYKVVTDKQRRVRNCKNKFCTQSQGQQAPADEEGPVEVEVDSGGGG